MVRWSPEGEALVGDGRPGMGIPAPAAEVQRGPSLDILATVFAFLSCVLYCLNGELLQGLQLHAPPGQGHASPMLNLVICHLGGLLLLPCVVSEQNGNGGDGVRHPKGGQWYLAGPSLFFATLLMGYNYCWLHSARLLPASVTNAIFQTSVALVCAASVIVFGETASRSRVFGVILSLAGSALACGLPNPASFFQKFSTIGVQAAIKHTGDPEDAEWLHTGIALAALASIGYATYQVLFKHWFGIYKSDYRFLALFGVWVSFWHIILFLPLVFVADALHLETLNVPRGPLSIGGTAVTALIASAVNMMYLAIVMWGSSMLLPCSSALSVPMTVALDFLMHGVRPKAIECVGHFMVAFSVILIMNGQGSMMQTGKRNILLGKGYNDV